jgi:hypothetical protein
MSAKWSIEADYFQACNCDYGCPCEFQAPPSRGFCEGVGAWRITKGNYGSVSLDGLAFGFIAHWPAAIHLGNGTALHLFDERANPQQRDALLRITSGEAGGMPFEIIVKTFTKVLDPQYVKFDFESKGKHAKVSAGKVLNMTVEPIRNPVTGEPESTRVVHETGFVFQSAEVLAGSVCESHADGLRFSWPDKSGFIARIKYGN